MSEWKRLNGFEKAAVVGLTSPGLLPFVAACLPLSVRQEFAMVFGGMLWLIPHFQFNV